MTTINGDHNESEKLAQIDLVNNLAEVLASSMTIYNSILDDIRKREKETNEDKLTINCLTDVIR